MDELKSFVIKKGIQCLIVGMGQTGKEGLPLQSRFNRLELISHNPLERNQLFILWFYKKLHNDTQVDYFLFLPNSKRQIFYSTLKAITEKVDAVEIQADHFTGSESHSVQIRFYKTGHLDYVILLR